MSMEKEISLLLRIRKNLVKELESFTLEQLNFIPKGQNNNIIWNIGHSLVVQQLLCYNLSNLEPYVDKAMIANYKRGTAPKGMVMQEEVDFIKEMLFKSVDLLDGDLREGKFQVYKPYTVGFGAHLISIEDALQFNNVHEGIHYGCLLALKKML